jgi:hypothetical protein
MLTYSTTALQYFRMILPSTATTAPRRWIELSLKDGAIGGDILPRDLVGRDGVRYGCGRWA